MINKYLRSKLILLIVTLSLLWGCDLKYGGFDFTVTGMEFKNATVILDGKVIGKVYYVDEIAEGLGGFSKFGIKAGRHNIVFMDNNGARLLEIDAIIPGGENYVHYSPEKKELRWNDKVFKVIPGKPVIVK